MKKTFAAYSALTVAAFTMLTGCAKVQERKDPVADATLSSEFAKAYGAKFRDAGIYRIELVCGSDSGGIFGAGKPNHIMGKVSLLGHAETREKTFPTNTPCNDAPGTLVSIAFDAWNITSAKSRHVYDKALIMGEIEKVYTGLFGSLSRNPELQKNLLSKYAPLMSALSVDYLNFTCDAKDKPYRYNGLVRGTAVSGDTNVQCAHAAQTWGPELRFYDGNPYGAGAYLPAPEVYRVFLTTSNLDASEAEKLMASFMASMGPRKSF